MLSNEEQNFFQIVEIEKIEESGVFNCIDITVDDDESFVLSNGIVSHNSAMGSILQKRDSKNDGVYALKGKIKNCKNIGDLSQNKEILELMHILGLDPTSKVNPVSSYKNIIIATDPDCLHEETLISTTSGSKKISEIISGDIVNTSRGEKMVSNVTEKIDDSYIEISISGKIIRCTRSHLFPVFREGEVLLVEAENINQSDLFFSKNPDYTLIRPDYVIEKKSEGLRFYDIEVEEDHDFYIEFENSDMKILSHNCDGFHIASLIINLFYKWFPDIIRRGRLGILKTPLISVGDLKKRKYYWDLEDFKKSRPSGNVRYLKGLGSLDLQDWEWVMKNKNIIGIEESSDSKEKLEMAFGDSSELRKKWLSE